MRDWGGAGGRSHFIAMATPCIISAASGPTMCTPRTYKTGDQCSDDRISREAGYHITVTLL